MSKRLDTSLDVDQEAIVRFFCAAGDPQRLEIIFLLASAGPMNAGSIADHSPLSRTAVSHHLKVLKDAGIVLSEKKGTEVTYSFDHESVVSRMQSVINAIQACEENHENQQG